MARTATAPGAGKGISIEAAMTLTLVLNGQRKRIAEGDARALYTQLHGIFGNRPAAIQGGGDSSVTVRYGSWTEAEKDTLRTLRGAGRPVENIAATLRRPATNVRRMMDELGLEE